MDRRTFICSSVAAAGLGVLPMVVLPSSTGQMLSLEWMKLVDCCCDCFKYSCFKVGLL